MKRTASTGYGLQLGGGESPLFPPQHATDDAARTALCAVIHRRPADLGFDRARWTLKGLMSVCPWLHLTTPGGMSALLHRLRIHWKRGRTRRHSPDSEYVDKVRSVQLHLRRVWLPTPNEVVLFQDEVTYYRQPTLAQAYAEAGQTQACAELTLQRNLWFRVVATLDAYTGRVLYRQDDRIGVAALRAFYATVCAQYPGQRIYLVQDNWPIHFHPDVLAALEPQEMRWQPHLPPNIRAMGPSQAEPLHLPIHLLPLPTYAPWTNPIEKLWRWLRQDVLHLHAYAERWSDLKHEVARFLDRFADGSADLLRYVGLTERSGQYGAAIRGSPI